MRDKIKLAHLEYRKDRMQSKIDAMIEKINNDELREEFKGEGEGEEEEEKAQPEVDVNR